jgi:non-specific serine/threonine protein kinase
MARFGLLRREEAEDGTVRFSMLETIRECALQQLAASGEEDPIRARQAAWAVTLAETAETHLFTDAEEGWLRRLERERANLRAALTWAIAAGDETTALRLAGALVDFWYLRGHIAEGEEALRRALAVGQTERSARVKALVGACLIAQLRGEANAAVAYGETALALARRLEDRAGVAQALTMLGNVVQNAGDYARARLLHEEALAAFLELEEPSWTATELCNLAWCWHGLGDDAAAVACLERLSTTGALAYDSFFAVIASLIRGDVALAAADLVAATRHYDEALAGARQRGDRWLAADALIGFAAALGATGQARRAARLLGTAATIYREIGAPFSPRDRPDYPRWLASIRSQLGEAAFAEAWAEGSKLTLERAIGEATRAATMLLSRQPYASAAC